jgi:hypothetical protein
MLEGEERLERDAGVLTTEARMSLRLGDELANTTRRPRSALKAGVSRAVSLTASDLLASEAVGVEEEPPMVLSGLSGR